MRRNKGIVYYVVKVGYWVEVWKVIRKDWHVVASKLSFVVGNGRRVLLWEKQVVWVYTTEFCLSQFIRYYCF